MMYQKEKKNGPLGYVEKLGVELIKHFCYKKIIDLYELDFGLLQLQV